MLYSYNIKWNNASIGTLCNWSSEDVEHAYKMRYKSLILIFWIIFGSVTEQFCKTFCTSLPLSDELYLMLQASLDFDHFRNYIKGILTIAIYTRVYEVPDGSLSIVPVCNQSWAITTHKYVQNFMCLYLMGIK